MRLEVVVTVIGDRYNLQGEVGRGGMAVVHRARDTRHGRDVAVKIMTPAVQDSIGPERFLREIETAARLQHPHIVPVFDSGITDGQLYFVMPLIQGESLRAALQREGRLGVEEAVRIVREIADALDYAHGQGIVHRDLKPENILMSRGHALLADFGIARAASQAGEHATGMVTEAGTVLGTPAYMSPELAMGSPDVGPASDVYALGCILFELLTGTTPFSAHTYPAALVQRATTEAPRVRSLRPEVPTSVDAAVSAALQRDPRRRIPTAGAFAAALGGSGSMRSSSAVPLGDRSIVVLPFDNLSPDPNDAYLADGLTEELIADLSRIKALRVIARNSSAAARRKTQDLKEIARMLDVRYLLEGSVRRAGHQLRITAQLIDGTTDSHLWADKYGGTMDDVFQMQERISQRIVEELRTRLTEEEANRDVPVTDPETYELYLRARHMMGQSLLRLPEAASLLEEVMRRDPGFAPACSALGAPLLLCALFNYIEPKAAWARIQELADRGLAVNPRSGAAHELLAAVATYRDWNWSEAERLYDRARELEPGAGFDRFLYAFFLSFSGNVRGAVEMAREGRRLDPLNFLGFLVESVMLTYAGETDAALPLARRPSELDPQFPEGYHITGYVLLARRDFAGAAERLQQAVDLSRRAAWPVAKLGAALANLGRRAEALALLDELERRASEATMSAPAVATLHLHLGDRASFYRWMNRAIDERDPFALSLNREFLWDAARHEPEFARLLDRVGLRP